MTLSIMYDVEFIKICYAVYTLRAESFANRKFRNFRDFGLFSRKFMPSKKVSGKFAKVIFAKTKLLTKIAKVFSQF